MHVTEHMRLTKQFHSWLETRMELVSLRRCVPFVMRCRQETKFVENNSQELRFEDVYPEGFEQDEQKNQIISDIKKAVENKKQFVIVSAPTGSGKSTTLASIVDVINKTQKGHIITIEDPVEFKHETQSSVITQREVGRDTKTFASALRASLREDPDVILVGELRDLETIQLALTAAETGHLVFGTLHTNSAPSTINRIIDVFPPEQQDQVRSQLASTLRCVITQKLLKRIDKSGRVAAFEIMICNTAIRNLIREDKVFQIANSMQMGKAEGQMLMENSLKELIAQGVISASDVEID